MVGVAKPYKSWLTETENGFMEPKYLAFRFGDKGHPQSSSFDNTVIGSLGPSVKSGCSD